MSEKPIINPSTKIRELIDAYPWLEEKLVEMAPAFKKLKSPVLRNTIARVTSLSQAAIIGNIDVSVMVNKLRLAVGQEPSDSLKFKNQEMMDKQPVWFKTEMITKTIDARPMLEAGHHPVNEVFGSLSRLNVGEILMLITGFIPMPLVDKARDKGYQVYYKKSDTDEFYTYFARV